MVKRVGLVAALALAVGACAGPSAPLEIGSKEIPVDITLGDQGQTPPPRPLGANPSPLAFPGFIQPPIPRPQPGLTEPHPGVGACPLADPLDAALLVARRSAPALPAQGAYRFRNQGSFTVDGVETAYPPTTKRTVVDPRPIDAEGNFEFGVRISLIDETTTTTYRVLNGGTLPDRGIYIVRVITERASGTDSFVPHQPILLLPFPPPELGTNLEDEIDDARGDTYRSSGTDPLTSTTMILEARLAGKARVDACGEWIDAFDVEVITGRIVGPSKQITFTGRYAVAPQYGGLIVEDDIQMEGTQDFVPVASANRARINRVPRDPQPAT